MKQRNPRAVRFSGIAQAFIAAALLMVLVSCTDGDNPGGVSGEVRIILVSPAVEGVQSASFDFVNGTSEPVRFTGYSLESPLYLIQVQRDGGWEDRFLGWCGTGLTIQQLPANSSRRFFAYCDTLKAEWRVGVQLCDVNSEPTRTVWSDAVPGL